MPQPVRPRVALPPGEAALLREIATPLTQAILRVLVLSPTPLRSGEIAAELAGINAATVRFALPAIEDADLIHADVPRGERAGRWVRYTAHDEQIARGIRLLGNYVLPGRGLHVEYDAYPPGPTTS